MLYVRVVIMCYMLYKCVIFHRSKGAFHVSVLEVLHVTVLEVCYV